MDRSTIPKQSAVLVHPPCQGQLCQEGEPVGEKPVPVGNKRSIISIVPPSHSLHFLLGRTLICEGLTLSPSNDRNVVCFQQTGTITPPSDDTAFYKLSDVFSASDPLPRGRLLSSAWRPDRDLHQCSDWIMSLGYMFLIVGERRELGGNPHQHGENERAIATAGDPSPDWGVLRKQRNRCAEFCANKVRQREIKASAAIPGMFFHFSY